MEKGTRVRFTANSLGTVRHPDQVKFEDHSVNQGEEGLYFGTHPNPSLKGWHLIEVEHDGERLFVPCGEDHFETVA